MNIFPHQETAFAELVLRANTYFAGDWRDFSVRPRFASMVCGPTGTGKTAIATKLAATVGASLLRVSANSWMPLGSSNKGTRETMVEIAKHVSDSNRSIIFLDELDKIYHETSWKSYIKAEIFDLLDGRWPAGLKSTEDKDDDDDPGEKSFSSISKNIERNIKLQYNTFIVAAGTFQDFFETRDASKIGFGDHHTDTRKEIDAEEIARRLPRELTNRFNGNLILLPSLQLEHYLVLAEIAAAVLPEWIQEEYRKAVKMQLPKAIAAQKGCRFVEECVLQALQVAKAPLEKKSQSEEGSACSKQ